MNLLLYPIDGYAAMFRMGGKNVTMIKRAFTIDNGNFVAHLMAQNADGMPGIFFRKHAIRCYFWRIEYNHSNGVLVLTHVLVLKQDGKSNGHYQRITGEEVPAETPAFEAHKCRIGRICIDETIDHLLGSQ